MVRPHLVPSMLLQTISQSAVFVNYLWTQPTQSLCTHPRVHTPQIKSASNVGRTARAPHFA